MFQRLYRLLGPSGFRRTRHLVAALVVLAAWVPFSPTARRSRARRAERGRAAARNATDPPAGRWDLEAALYGGPASRAQLLWPVGEAVRLSYEAPPGYYHRAGGGNPPEPRPLREGAAEPPWQRVPEAEVASESGLSAVVLRQGGAARRAIVAFRGACFDSGDHRCRRDFCAGWLANGGSVLWAVLSDWKALYGAFYCRWTWTLGDLDYLASAVLAADAAEAALPGHALLLTGHSLGGLLAILAAARAGLQAVALAPPRVDLAASADDLNLGSLTGPDLWSVYHMWDPVYQDVLDAGPASLAGVGTCVFRSGVRELVPAACEACAASRGPPQCRRECFKSHLFQR